MFKRILVPLDASEQAERALPLAAQLARGSGGTVIFLHVVDMGMSYAYAANPAYIQITLDTARKYLSDVTTSELFADLPTESYLGFGSVTSEILAIADSSGADSIVMTSHGRSGIPRWVLGSVAEFVVRHASLPILLLKDESTADFASHREGQRPVRVLVPLDGSFLAKSAIEPAALLASALAAPSRGTLQLTRVVKPDRAMAGDGRKNSFTNVERYLTLIAEQAREEPPAGSDGRDLRITWSVIVGQDPVEGIISAAEIGDPDRPGDDTGSCDVIAMATNGRSGLRRLIMGSVTEGVLSNTRLPLLIVRPSEGQAAPETQEREFPLTRPGAVYPKDYLMAVIDDVQEAQDAVETMQRAGVPQEHIRLFERHEIIEYVEDTERTRSLGSRIADVFQAITSDEDAHVLAYVEEALRGHVILNVYTPTPEQAEHVKDILVQHHARSIRYFGRWAITILHH